MSGLDGTRLLESRRIFAQSDPGAAERRALGAFLSARGLPRATVFRSRFFNLLVRTFGASFLPVLIGILAYECVDRFGMN